MPNTLIDKGPQPTPWEKELNNIKNLWVISVVFFWLSVFFQIGLYVMDGHINIVLLSIITGMMVLGVALKLRLKRYSRSNPDK